MATTEKIVDGFTAQRAKQNLITRLTGAADVGQDDQRIGCKICGFPGHTATNCYNLVRLNSDKFGGKSAKLLELSSTSSEDDDGDLIEELKKKKAILEKSERGENLSKGEVKFLKKHQMKAQGLNPDGTVIGSEEAKKAAKKRKKLAKKRRRRRHDSSSDSSDSDDDEDFIKSSSKKSKKKRKKSKKSSSKYDDKDEPKHIGEAKTDKCQICFIEKAKYRCPKCRILYCVDEKAEFKCFREHKEKKICEERIAKGLHIKPASKEDSMDIKEKLAIALKRRKRRMREQGLLK